MGNRIDWRMRLENEVTTFFISDRPGIRTKMIESMCWLPRDHLEAKSLRKT